MVKKFSAILLIWLLWSGSAAALSIESDFVPDVSGSLPTKYLNQGESFSYTFTAYDTVGEVHWALFARDSNGNISQTDFLGNVLSQSVDVRISSSTGKTITVSGTFSSNYYSLSILAYDDPTFRTGYANYGIALLDYDYFYGGDDNNISPTPSPSPIPTPSPEVPTDDVQMLPEATIRPLDLSEIGEDVIRKIARHVSMDVSFIYLVRSEDILPARDPTDEMKRQAKEQNLEFVAKINGISIGGGVNSGASEISSTALIPISIISPDILELLDGEPIGTVDGKTLLLSPDAKIYYLFELNVPPEMVGKKVSDFKLFYDTNLTNVDASVRAASDPFAVMEIYNFLGDSMPTFGKTVIAGLLGSAGQSLTVWFVKTILLLLAGCDSGTLAGIGIVGLTSAGGVILLRKIFRKP